jgi:DNA-binding SARP family transcriptional activator/tetratricopeptide (TPR) repeat protein
MPTPLIHDLPQLLLLGSFDLRWQGASLNTISYTKMRALLAYLAMNPREHSREALAGFFWPESDGATARGNLRRTLADLKRALPTQTGDWFVTTKNSLGFCSNAVVDAKVFMGLQNHNSGLSFGYEQRLALYRGEFLSGMSLPDCNEFENWLLVQRETLHRQALAMCEHESNHHEKLGDIDKALKFSLELIALEPWHEESYCRAMRLYALKGQIRAALTIYNSCSQKLKTELGVMPNENTRHLAEKIRDLGNNAQLSLEVSSTPENRIIDISPQATSMVAERRQVTVLYCELITTDFDAYEDPDDVFLLLQASQAAAMKLVERFDGHVVQTHGGGFLVYFGFPLADENAARRAVQAGLALARTKGLEIYSSIHTGLIISDGNSGAPDTTGRTSKIAIQLRHYAAQRGVVISETTHALVMGYFNCVNLGVESTSDFSPHLKIPMFHVVAETGAQTRLEAALRLTPMVGREQEITHLLTLWQDTLQGRTGAHLMQAEAGFGKSRLVLALKEQLTHQKIAISEMRCFSELSKSPYHPLIVQLEIAIGFQPNASSAERFTQLKNVFAKQYSHLQTESLAAIAKLLSIDEGEDLVAEWSPQKLKEKTELTLLDMLDTLSVQQPVLLIVDDVHWIDPSSMELLTTLLTRQSSQQHQRILTLITARPEFVAPWSNKICHKIVLDPLSNKAVQQIITHLGEDIPIEVMEQIIRRSDGVPLYVEELVKAAKADQFIGVPARLQDLLMARIDRLGDARFTAQLASCLGRVFELAVLQHVVPYEPHQLSEYLNELQEAGLIQPQRETCWQFKHALIQDAAYDSQTKHDRQNAHRRIAQVLQKNFKSIVELQPELLAQHWASGGDALSAISFWIKAGQRAMRSSANGIATEHFKSALKLLNDIPAGLARDCNEFAIWINYSPLLYSVSGYDSADARQANTRIAELSAQVSDRPELFFGKWSMVTNTIANSIIPDDAAFASTLQRLVLPTDKSLDERDKPSLTTNRFQLGEFDKSDNSTSIALFQPADNQQPLEKCGTDLSILSTSYVLCSLFFLGEVNRAILICEATLTRARALGHPHTLASALCSAASLYRWLDEPDTVMQLGLEIVQISQEHDFPHWLAWGEMSQGWALVQFDQQDTGFEKLHAVIGKMNAAALDKIPTMFVVTLVEAYMKARKFDAALPLLEEALAELAQTGESGFHHAEIYRLLGECLLALSHTNLSKASVCFDQALDISTAQGALTLVDRAQKSKMLVTTIPNKPNTAF